MSNSNTRKKVGFDLSKVQEKLGRVESLSDLTGPDGPMQELMAYAVQNILEAERDLHLGYESHQKAPEEISNRRNGYSKKRLKTSSGPLDLDIPRDREGSFTPQFIEKFKSFDPDLEKKIIGMYGRGMSTREVSQQLSECYATEVSPTFVSQVTDKLLEGITEWQARPLADVYAVLYMDAIHFKIRENGVVVTKAAYSALGIDLEGQVDVLGIWIGEAEGAHFWSGVLTDLRERGVKDILIACVDGLKGFPEAIASIFPQTDVQLCIIHQIRTSIRYLSFKHRKKFLQDLKEVYRAPNVELAEARLDDLEARWSKICPMAVRGWRENWVELSFYFNFPPEVRRMIYTTNAVEALHRQFRKVTKTRSAFPTDESLMKMLYLAILNLRGSLKNKRGWSQILGQLKLYYGDRIKDSHV